MLLFFSLRGTCKHVSAICHNMIEKVVMGENKTATERRQTWHKPSKRIHTADFLENIHIQKVHGIILSYRPNA